MNATRERGAALLAMLAVIMLGASWFLVSQLNAETGAITAVNRARNAAVLNRAKTALIGYVAMQAAEAGEKNPGRLPCPEAINNVGTTSEGISAPVIVPATPACSSIGRLPWRTLGLERLYDSAGEPLWYVVGPGWRLATSASTLLINSNTAGDTTVDGQQVVALIIAPGPAINAQAAAGCAAKNQSRAAPSPTMDASNYIECFDSGTLQFVTTASSSSYNDQAIRITVADVMPAIEAAIANRIEREILPALQTVYMPAAWGITNGSNPVMPFAAPFASPGPGASTASYQGAGATYAGLLPFNQTQGCTESATDRRCTTVTTGTSATTGLPAFLVFSKSGNDVQTAGGGSIRTQSTCGWSSNVYVCNGLYNDTTISFTSTFNITNVAMGLRKLDYSKVTVTAMNDVAGGIGTQNVTFTASTVLNADGSATMTIATGPLPVVSDALVGWGTYAAYRISIDRAAFGDHDLLSTTNAITGWFARNEWYRLLYYAVAPSNTTNKVGSDRKCSPPTTDPSDCLSVTNMNPSSKSAILVLAGRSLNGVARSSPTLVLSDFLEFGNANGSFEKLSVTPAAAMIYADTGTPDAYTVAVPTLATGASFQFRATNANTGNSTLSTIATGNRELVNRDGSNLAAGTIRANAAVEVNWDGTRFLLSKRPFNDRFAAIASN